MAGPINVMWQDRSDMMLRMGKRVDISGQRFSRLVVMGFSGTDSQRRSVWSCRCDCGNVVTVRWASLRDGHSVSCGCYNRDNARRLGEAKHKGDKIKYQTAHDRLRRHRGSAKRFDCVDCGATAAQWSLRHDSKKRITGKTQHSVMSWSPNVEDYEPRCIPCHRSYDQGGQ